MRTFIAFILCMGVASVGTAELSHANAHGEISKVIEGFIKTQFPEAGSHFWIVNGTEWRTDSEVIVDINTVIMHSGQTSAENRYLLLIASGKLAGAQRIPLDAAVECNEART